MHSNFYRRCFQLVLAAVLGYGCFRILEPLLGMLGWAAVLAFILYPLHERLTRSLKGRRVLSAGIITGLTPFFVLAPLAVLGVEFAGQVSRLIELVRGLSLMSFTEVLNRLSTYPLIGTPIAWLRDSTSVTVAQVQGWISGGAQAALKAAASMGGGVALSVFGTLLGFFMMLFMLFFFLRDGRAILEALARLIPVERERRTQLLKYLADVTRAVVFGSAATAVLQGVIVGIGFAIVRLPAALVFGVLAMITAFLPAGSAVVVVPAILYLAFAGRWGAVIFLTFWMALLWIAENVLRPLITAHHAEVSTLVLFVGAIGGAAAYGILGLVIGPVLLSFVVALARFAQQSVPAEA